MPRVRVTVEGGTYHADVPPHRLPQGHALDVDEETARRWVKNGIAQSWDGPTGYVDEAHATASVQDLDAEIARLRELRDRVQAAPAEARAEAAVPEEHPFAKYDLSEQQRVNLQRAGFTRQEHLEQDRKSVV